MCNIVYKYLLTENEECFNPYPAGTKTDKSLPPFYSQASLHIRAVLSGSILLADHFQVLIMISLKMIMDSYKMEGGLFHLRNSAG